METKLARIAQIAKERPKEKFTSLAHLIDEDMLLECHKELSGSKAVGIDEVTQTKYAVNIQENIKRLHESLKNKTYIPQPVRRVYIPKSGKSKLRPLGIPAYEDKIVQLAISKILTAIFEQDFMDFSYGFRPKRSAHDALKNLNEMIMTKKINWIVDADIRGFFEHVDHKWMMRCLEERISDTSLLRLIARILKSGVMENGEIIPTEEGTPQGGIISPILANIYLHYVLDLWFARVMKKRFKGSAEMVRYADDFICGFQYKEEATTFYKELIERLKKFNLKIAQEKSKIIEFGLFAVQNRKARGEKKPETFDFLGFTHYCGTSRTGKFRVKRKTSRKKFKAAVHKMKKWIKFNRTKPINKLWKEVAVKLMGHYRYYGVTDNSTKLANYLYITKNLLFKWLNRRSQKRSYTWEKFKKYLEANPLPMPKIYVKIGKRGLDIA